MVQFWVYHIEYLNLIEIWNFYIKEHNGMLGLGRIGCKTQISLLGISKFIALKHITQYSKFRFTRWKLN